MNSVQGAPYRELSLEISVPNVEFFIALFQTLAQVSDSSQKLPLMDESGEPWQNVLQMASVLEIQLDENERCVSSYCLQILLGTSHTLSNRSKKFKRNNRGRRYSKVLFQFFS